MILTRHQETGIQNFQKFLLTLISHIVQLTHLFFLLNHEFGFVYLLLYVDDIVLTVSDLHLMNLFKDLLHNHFKIKDLDRLEYFLGIEVARLKKGIFYANDNMLLISYMIMVLLPPKL